MATLQQRLRDPKRIKLAALATAILAISIGLGVGLGGRGKHSVSSSSNDEDALGKYASGKVGEIIEPISKSTNYARYYGDGYADYSSATTIIRGSSGIDNSGYLDYEGGTTSSTTTSKCDKVSSSAKAEKSGGRTRRLGGGSSWASSVWSPSVGVDSGSTTTSIGESTSSAMSKSGKSVEVSGELIWYEDEDCGTTTEVAVANKASNDKGFSGASSKASKTKSSKELYEESSAKSTPATVSSAWERSPPATVSSVWGRSPETPETPEPVETSSLVPTLAPSSPQLESLAPVQSSGSPTLSPIDETITTAPTPCTSRLWYFNEEKKKCINDEGNDGEDEYENMRTCCEMELGINVECPYEDVCFSSSPTPKLTTAKPIGPEQLPTTATPSMNPSTAPSDSPITTEIVTESPTTSAPITSEPTSAAPTSDAPTIPEIITDSPTTSAPITSEPTSAAPTSDSPTIPEIITDSPTTSAPITSEPTSAAPTSDSPTIPEIITESPTTSAPITSEPTSTAPTTEAPTIPEIVTAEPTTTEPTSAKPTTSKPTHSKHKPTAKPTTPTPEIISAEPTMEVTVVELTVAPTPCDDCDGGRKWYYNGEKCTNNGKYAESDDIVFENLQTCCKESFGVNVDCPYEDVCNKGSPTTSPMKKPEVTPIPTGMPVETILTSVPSPSPTPCEGRKWYIVNISQETFQCTNGYDIPASAVDDFTFFDCLEDCCADAFGKGVECEHSDVCSNETPQPSSLELTTPPTQKITTTEPTTAEIITTEPTTLVPTKMLTAEPTTAVIITVEPTSPVITVEPTAAEIFTTEPTSPEIVTLVPTTAELKTVEPTPVPPSAILTLAPTTCKERVWYLYGGICTNMIESTSNDTDSSKYSTVVECCQNEMPGKKCAFEDACYSQAPSPGSSALESIVPTTQPSFGSTPTVSKETTGPPTVLVPDRTRGHGTN